jgi:hypothetical protein
MKEIRLKLEGVHNHIPSQRCVENLRNESNIKKNKFNGGLYGS